MTRLTAFGGVGQIGGNKILLEDKDTKVLLDFGTGFSDGEEFFDGDIQPRRVNGAGDLFEFGILPEIRGLYSEDALQNTDIRHTAPDVDAVLLSHYHWDHMGRISYVDPEVPVYCGKTTALIHEAYSEMGYSPLNEHEIRTFRTGDRVKIGSLEVQPVHIDHSIPGAYGFVIHTSEGPVAYTGDFRFHGPAGHMTEDFIAAARREAPRVLVTEGTRVSPSDEKAEATEARVLQDATGALRRNSKLVFTSFRGNDVDRVNSFDRAARRNGRRLVVSTKIAALLSKLALDGKMRVPRVGKDVAVYMRRKKSGRLDDSDYYKWERRFLDEGVSASDVSKGQSGYLLHLDVRNFPEIIDIKPERGGAYIHSSSEAFNEEGAKEEEVIRHWVDHIGFSYHQIHASGHAPMGEVLRLVKAIGAEKVVPIHTEHPELFLKHAKHVRPPKKGVPVTVKGT